MKIAIIGAGFCGLAVAWHLLDSLPLLPNLELTLFDKNGIGGGASGMAAGLFHPFSGAHAKLNWSGMEGFQATQQLLSEASLALGHAVTAEQKGILRLALTEEQRRDFKLCADRYPNETEWLEEAACQKKIPGCAKVPGLWIKEGLTVYSSLYLQGLWLACAPRGVHLVQTAIDSLQELNHYDLLIVTAGAESLQLSELTTLPITLVKGQILELSWPSDYRPLPHPINSHIYLLMSEHGNSCLVGSTYEKNQTYPFVDRQIAEQEILPKAYELFPALQNSKVLNCFAGMRAVSKHHRPLLQKLSPFRWLLTGMGSKGLLYHALFAKELVKQILHEIYN